MNEASGYLFIWKHTLPCFVAGAKSKDIAINRAKILYSRVSDHLKIDFHIDWDSDDMVCVELIPNHGITEVCYYAGELPVT